MLFFLYHDQAEALEIVSSPLGIHALLRCRPEAQYLFDIYSPIILPTYGSSPIGEASCVSHIAPSVLQYPVHSTSTPALLGPSLFHPSGIFGRMSEPISTTHRSVATELDIILADCSIASSG